MNTKHRAVSSKITAEEWREITKAFKDTHHAFLVEALQKNGNTPTEISDLNSMRPLGYYSGSWGVVQVNHKLKRLSLPFTIRHVRHFCGKKDDSGSVLMFKIERKSRASHEKRPQSLKGSGVPDHNGDSFRSSKFLKRGGELFGAV